MEQRIKCRSGFLKEIAYDLSNAILKGVKPSIPGTPRNTENYGKK